MDSTSTRSIFTPRAAATATLRYQSRIGKAEISVTVQWSTDGRYVSQGMHASGLESSDLAYRGEWNDPVSEPEAGNGRRGGLRT